MLRKIYFHNINSSNQLIEEIGNAVIKINPELVGFIETSPIQEEEFDLILEKYPERISLPRDDNFGFSVYSKHPLKLIEVGKFEDVPIFVVFDVTHLNTKFILVHLPPPIWKEAWDAQEKALIELEKYWVSNKSVLIIGDLNMTPWSYHYSHFFTKIMPKHYSSNLNFKGSWPSFLPSLFQLPIDHVFSRQPFSMEILPALGSDHTGFLLNY